ncbi:hypothetical protein D9M72_463560 [compost metagenome]
MKSGLAHRLARSTRHPVELSAVVADVRDLVRHDQVILRIDRRLDVVAHKSRALGLRDHRTGIGIGGRALSIRLVLQLLLGFVELAHLIAQLADLVLQSLGLGFDLCRLRAVRRFQRVEVALDALLDLLLARINLGWRDVAVPAVHCLELAAVDGHDGLGEQLELTAHADEALADIADADAVVVTKVGDGLEVRSESAGEPHQLDVALGFAFQAPAGLDTVQVAVDVELEKHRRVVRRPTGSSGVRAFEAECLKIKFLDEGLDDSHRVVFADIVIKTFRQQRDLLSVFAFDESLHGHLAENGCHDFI